MPAKSGMASSWDEAMFFLASRVFPRGENLRSKIYTLNEDPQPQVLFTLGFSNLKPAPSRVST